jgi:hypothetical protein
VVPLKTRQVTPLELQTPPVASPAGESFRGYYIIERWTPLAVRRRRKFNIVVYSQLKLNIVVWPEAKVII